MMGALGTHSSLVDYCCGNNSCSDTGPLAIAMYTLLGMQSDQAKPDQLGYLLQACE